MKRGKFNPPRKTVFDDLGGTSHNLYCRFDDLTNEASVESFFILRLLADLGYQDSQIKTKHSLQLLSVGRGRKKEEYKPDYALMYHGSPRCIIDAKGVNEDLDKWIEQCSGYCLALNRKYQNQNPVRYFMLSNGTTTILYEWDKDEPLISLDFSDFDLGNRKYEHLKSIISERTVATSSATSLKAEPSTFKFKRPTISQAKLRFVSCHKVIWKSEGYAPGPAFFAFVKLMFVKLWADRNIRRNSATEHLFQDDVDEVKLPKDVVIFSEHWIKQRNKEGAANPINEKFIQLRGEIEVDIGRRRKKRIFEKDEELGLKPETILDVVQRLQHVDLFGIDEDLNGRLFETFLNATMRGRELGQFFTPRSVVKMMVLIADLHATKERQDRVIDGCCGSGGFLIETLTVMRNKVRNNLSLSMQEKDDLIKSVANSCIYGIDFGRDPPLARIARINMYLHGDGGSRIYHADALDKDTSIIVGNDPEAVQNMQELEDELGKTQFDVVLTNPPFSMTKEAKNPSDRKILKRYELAKRNETSTEIRPSLRSSVMFMERYFGMLKPGGRLITVIDETLLSSDDFPYVRDYIRAHFLIKAIVSLPGDTFRQSGSRVKTSALVLEKKCHAEDSQPHCFYFFSEHLGIDDLTSKASELDTEEARKKAEEETKRIVDGYSQYLKGNAPLNVLEPERLLDRLDLRNCVPLFGRMAEQWDEQGIPVKRLDEVVTPTENTIKPSEMPNEMFILMKVAYDGKCRVIGRKIGNRIRADKMHRVNEGQVVFSKIRATDGAIGVVPLEMDGALVSKSSYTVFDCETPYDAAYLWSVLRSYEIRADMQSLSPGSGRYTSYWPNVGQIRIPWPDAELRAEIGNNLIRLWEDERRLEDRKLRSTDHLDQFGVESEDSKRRWTASKAPQ